MSRPSTAPDAAPSDAPAREIRVNGRAQTVRSPTLGALLLELGFEGSWLGTAVNGELVTRERRATHPIEEGDRIEILSPMQGG